MRRILPGMGCPAALLLAAALAAAPSALLAGPVAERVTAHGVVRVCIWPGYHGVT
ncbi:hypothetical protein RCH27_15430 [Paracidovorax citrulli]